MLQGAGQALDPLTAHALDGFIVRQGPRLSTQGLRVQRAQAAQLLAANAVQPQQGLLRHGAEQQEPRLIHGVWETGEIELAFELPARRSSPHGFTTLSVLKSRKSRWLPAIGW